MQELHNVKGSRRNVKWNDAKKCFNLIDSFNDYLISRYAGRKAV